MLDADCPKFEENITNVCRSCDTDHWNHEDPSKPCDEKICMLCQGPKAKRNRKEFWENSESLSRIHSYNDENVIHPQEEHLVKNWNENSLPFAGWLVSAEGTCRHDRYTRCGCYRQKAANYGILKNFREQEEKPCIELHNYNFGWNMGFHAYSSKVGLGNTPVRFTGELVRPYDLSVEAKDEVRLLKDRLRVNQPFGWPRGIWDRWQEVSPTRPTPRGRLENYPHWNPAVNWNVEGPRLIGHGYKRTYSREDYYRYLPTKRPNPYLTQVAYSIDSTKDYDAFLDFPRWIDNTKYWAWDSPYDEKPEEEGGVPTPIRWLDDQDTAVLRGQMCLSTPITNVREDAGGSLAHSDRNALNGYNPHNHKGVRHLKLYLNSMTSQLREILSVNAMYRNHFGMPIKQMYYGALHQEAKIMRHYTQMANPTIAAVIEAQQLGVATIQRMNFLREHREFERICATDVGHGFCFMDVLKARLPNYIIIEHLMQSLKDDFHRMTNVPYEMPNHPSCQIITKKRILNTEKLILHMAYIGYDDMTYFQSCYSRIYRCRCPLII